MTSAPAAGRRLAQVVALARIFAIGACGGLVFQWIGLPAPFLSGPMVAVSIAAILGHSARIPTRLAETIYLVVGMSLGSGVSPEAIADMGRWPLSLALLLVYIAVVQFSAQAYFQYVCGWSRESSFFAAIPGALSYTLALGAYSRADMRLVAISQTVRVFILVAATPSILVALQAADPRPIAQRVVAGPLDILLMLAAGIIGGFLAARLKVPAPWLVGALISDSILHGTAVVTAPLPAWIFVPGMIALGSMAGSRFLGTDLAMLRHAGIASVGGFLVMAVITAIFAGAAHWVTGISIAQTLLGFAPGGIDAMAMMAFVLGLDAAYVAVHHLVRFFAIAIAAPVYGRDMLRRGDEPDLR